MTERTQAGRDDSLRAVQTAFGLFTALDPAEAMAALASLVASIMLTLPMPAGADPDVVRMHAEDVANKLACGRQILASGNGPWGHA